jgi:hypothetical protein
MNKGIDRRHFVRGMIASAIVVGSAGSLRAALAGAATVAGPGPYGALGAADANGIQLPAGFTSRLLATSGQAVAGTSTVWHDAPDGGACFPLADGGWVYVSNSEVALAGGGASALRFDGKGAIVDAYRILSGTHRNCAGGRTVAGTWLSCEENGSVGQVFECDPRRPGQGVVRPLLGSFNHEAAVEDPTSRTIYLTEDDPAGRLYRFVPAVAGDLTAGQLFAASVTDGLVSWVPASSTAPDRQAITTPFAGGEGLWIDDGVLYLTTKGDRRVWELQLATQTISVLYDAAVTVGAALNAVDNCTVHEPSGDVFVCEDGGNMEVCLITAGSTDRIVAPFLRIIGHDASEWCGAAFSPDQSRLYVSSQRGDDGRGRTYEITGPFRTAPSPTTTTTTAPPVGPVAVTAVATAATWRYHDLGTDLGTTWRTTTYNDTTWKTGTAPLGYGDPVTTTISRGTQPTNRPITAYFRHTFTVTGTTPLTDLVLRIRRDDGAVIHLDGTELARTNMPTGTITATTRALSSINDAAETTTHTIIIPTTRTIAPGTHVLAVELHQYQPSSSDLSFDLTLTGTQLR